MNRRIRVKPRNRSKPILGFILPLRGFKLGDRYGTRSMLLLLWEGLEEVCYLIIGAGSRGLTAS